MSSDLKADYDRAFALAERAKSEETGDLEVSKFLFSEAAAAFFAISEQETNAKSKSLVRAQCKELLSRGEAVQKKIELSSSTKQSSKSSSSSPSSSSSSTPSAAEKKAAALTTKAQTMLSAALTADEPPRDAATTVLQLYRDCASAFLDAMAAVKAASSSSSAALLTTLQKRVEMVMARAKAIKDEIRNSNNNSTPSTTSTHTPAASSSSTSSSSLSSSSSPSSSSSFADISMLSLLDAPAPPKRSLSPLPSSSSSSSSPSSSSSSSLPSLGSPPNGSDAGGDAGGEGNGSSSGVAGDGGGNGDDKNTSVAAVFISSAATDAGARAKLTQSELAVLRKTSCVNGVMCYPFFQFDIDEQFKYDKLWVDKDGLVPLSPAQMKSFKVWMRPHQVRIVVADVCFCCCCYSVFVHCCSVVFDKSFQTQTFILFSSHQCIQVPSLGFQGKPVMIRRVVSPTAIKQTLITDCSFVSRFVVQRHVTRSFRATPCH
jgi:hypothetical protein